MRLLAHKLYLGYGFASTLFLHVCVSTVQGIGDKLQTHPLPKGFGVILLPWLHTMIWYSMISLL